MTDTMLVSDLVDTLPPVTDISTNEQRARLRHPSQRARKTSTPIFETATAGPRAVLSTWVDAKLVHEIDKLAAAKGVNRSAILRMMIQEGVALRTGFRTPVGS